MICSKVLVPSGVLGLGFDIEALKNGLNRKPDIISIDGGSTDSGHILWVLAHLNIPGLQ